MVLLRMPRRFDAQMRRFRRTHANHSRAFLRDDKRGAAAVEFALIGPLLIALLMGVVSYGSYFLTAHTVQQLANDAARAAIAGLDDSERQSIARQTVAEGVADEGFLQGGMPVVTVSRANTMLNVSVSYDARRDVWAQGLVPMPSPTITRVAAIRLGDY